MGAGASQPTDGSGETPDGQSARRLKTAVVVEEREEPQQEEGKAAGISIEIEQDRLRDFCNRKNSWETAGCADSMMCSCVDDLMFEEIESLTPVTLHVYDVGTSRRIRHLNRFLRKLGTGLFHCGVEVFGSEWSFCDTGGECGVFRCQPGHCGGFRHVEAIDLGRTSLSKTEFAAVIEQLQAEWFSEAYDLLAQNCCHFCHEMCQRLGVASPPEWVNNFAGSLEAIAAFIEEKAEGEQVCTLKGCPLLSRSNSNLSVGSAASGASSIIPQLKLTEL